MKKFVSLCTTISIVFTMFSTFAVFADSTAADVEISTLAELEAFRDNVNAGNSYEGKTVKLTADIDMSEKYGEDQESWTSIGSKSNPFSGVFDGENHKINGLYISSIKSYQGLLGYISHGTVTKLAVDGSVSSNDQIIGGIVAYSAGGIVSKCSFSGTVYGTYYVAGVVGWASGGLVSDCDNTGAISAEKGYVGGVLGESNGGAVTNCYNTGAISGKDSNTGGVAGWTNCPLSGCYNTGTVTGKTRNGGIVGSSGGTISGCYNTGVVTGTSGYTGGIVGSNDNTVTNCYNIGAISGTNYIGGIIGTNGDTVTNCYNIGTITATGTNCIGGIAGHHVVSQYVHSEMSNCYYLDTTAIGGFDGTDMEGWVKSKTAVEFADKLNFVNWDFDMVWEMDDTLKRPVLRSNKENPPIETNMYEIKYENEKAVATVPQDGTYTVIFAAYDSGGRLLSVSAQNIPLIQGKNKPIEPKAGFHKNGTVKVLLWGGLNGMKPLCSPDEK